MGALISLTAPPPQQHTTRVQRTAYALCSLHPDDKGGYLINSGVV